MATSTTSIIATNQPIRQNIPVTVSSQNVNRFLMDSTSSGNSSQVQHQLKRQQSLTHGNQNFLLQKSTSSSSNQQCLVDNMRNSRLVHKQLLNNSVVGYYDSFGVTVNQPIVNRVNSNLVKNVIM
jgi:hypothetical protein